MTPKYKFYMALWFVTLMSGIILTDPFVTLLSCVWSILALKEGLEDGQ